MRYLEKSFSFPVTQQPVSDADWARAFSRRPPLRVVLLGHSFVGAGCLRALQAHPEVRIEAVHGYLATEEDVPCPNVLAEAQAGGLRVVYHNDPPDLAELLTTEADVLISANWRHMIPPGIYERFPCAVGFHGSDLKSYRGRAPIQRQVADGKLEYHLSLFKLAEKPDTGELVGLQVGLGQMVTQRTVRFPAVPSVAQVYYSLQRPAFDLTTELIQCQLESRISTR